jgi:uncharacterized protein YbcI
MSAEPAVDTRSSPRRSGAGTEPLLEIGDAMVRLYKEAFGRGRTKVRAMLAGQDTLVVVLEDAFTVAEQTLVALDGIDQLHAARLLIQEALEERARSAVERALGRGTRAFITGFDPCRGVSINVFTLEPAAVADGDQRAALDTGVPG